MVLAMNALVAQLGARMHYAVPRIFSEAGCLERLYTDFCASKGWPRWFALIPERFRPRPVRRLLGRTPLGIPPNKITSFNSLGLAYRRRLQASQARNDALQAFLWAGREFCRRILRQGLGNAELIYAFNSAALEIADFGRRKGLKIVIEQTIAPRAVEIELLARESDSFPGWEADRGENHLDRQYVAREKAEWNLADIIVCGSPFVRESIAACGGPVDKCVVVPYGVDRPLPPLRYVRSGPLRVLAVGTIGLRKGSPYVLEAARRLKGLALLRMVGSCDLSGNVRHAMLEHCDVIGPVPRSQLERHFAWADVFLLPSICEGSATATYEALAAGLPVVTTRNAGSVVRDGVDGFIVPIRDPEAITTHLCELAARSDLRLWMSRNARQRASEFTVAAYGRRLLSSLNPPCDRNTSMD